VKTNFNDGPSSGEEDNSLLVAFQVLDKTQKNFFDAASNLVRIPTAKKLDTFNLSLQANGEAFHDVINELTSDEEIAPQEKSMQIATLLISTDKDRVDHFNAIAPKGKFATLTESQSSVSNMILKIFENQEDPDTICVEIVNNYANHLNADTKRLIESVESSNKLKLINYAEQAIDNASHIGKISLGVAIGSIIANRIIKKLDS